MGVVQDVNDRVLQHTSELLGVGQRVLTSMEDGLVQQHGSHVPIDRVVAPGWKPLSPNHEVTSILNPRVARKHLPHPTWMQRQTENQHC